MFFKVEVEKLVWYYNCKLSMLSLFIQVLYMLKFLQVWKECNQLLNCPYCRSPLPHHFVEVSHVAGYPVLSDPHMFEVPMETPGKDDSTLETQLSYLSFAPPEVIDRDVIFYDV